VKVGVPAVIVNLVSSFTDGRRRSQALSLRLLIVRVNAMHSLRQFSYAPILICVAALAGCSGRQSQPLPQAQPSADYQKLTARFLPVKMPFDVSALSLRERQLVAKLAEATAQLDELFWQQSDPDGLALYRSLAGSQKAEDQQLRRLLRINGGRYDLVSEHMPFAGAPPHPPGAAMFPRDLTREAFDQYVAAHPEQKAALYDPFTVVRRKGDVLEAVPYHVAYAQWLTPIVQSLRAAAELADDAAFARFLRLRADALLTDDYFASDIAWVELKQPTFDVIFAPYETYLDDFLGVKTSYGAAVLVRNDAESRKLDVFQRFVPDIQQALPLAAADKPSKVGQPTPMEVMEAPLRGGDLRHGYQAVADNLPNDSRVHEKVGTKKIFFRNYMDARVQGVIVPLAQRLLNAEQAPLATPEGYLNRVLMHEVGHGIGPAFARTAVGKQDIRAAIGPIFSGLEESKADVVSLYALKWLADHGHLGAAQLQEAYAAAVTDDLRSARFGTAEAHGKGSVMQFNYMREQGAISRDAASGRYTIAFERMPAVVAALAKELLEQEATGDRARATAWFEKYGKIGPELAAALAKATDVPIDIDPQSDYPEL
jgi:hypothetical protein